VRDHRVRAVTRWLLVAILALLAAYALHYGCAR